ncbi:hypothetical protein Tco_0933295 [Tanacetum coccineum]
MDEEFTTTAYPNVQENLKLPTEDQVRLEEPASFAGTLSSLQNLDKELSFADYLSTSLHNGSSTTTNINSNGHNNHNNNISFTTTNSTTTRLLIFDLNSAHRSILYKLENLDIPHQVSKVVDEIVTDAVDWAIQAPLRDRFRDLPEADMKEILHHRLWETKSYEAHEDHKKLYKALEKLMDCDHSEQLITDLDEARRKKKRSHESPKTPPGSPPHQPPPPPPPSAASSSSKTTNLAKYTAWTTTDTRLKPSVSSIPEDLPMDPDSAPDEPWKPLSEEDRPATPEPAWSIPSSDLPVPMNNRASALASTYAPLPENSLLAQTGDMAIFMDWFCKKQGIT